MIRIATRSSLLARAQASQVAGWLGEATLVEVSSGGEPGDKSRFVRGVERALIDELADIGVHSAKDLPAEMAAGLAIAAVPRREDARDVWVGPGSCLEDVPEGARVGTASLRRRAQLLAARPDLRVEDLHGNVDTRLGKLASGALDAIVLAAAGLGRLGRDSEAAFAIPPETMTPAAGQGALALQASPDNEEGWRAASRLGDDSSMRELLAERAAVAVLEATCATPIGVHAHLEGEAIYIQAFVGLPDGSEWIRDHLEGEASSPAEAGGLLAERLGAAGAREILARAEET
ncbi:MAG TPA: hydroxymethylbilane synthase [Solirubrobacterales bacterium]|nr:hydroxymethylbilane synthase [Solirubrobacterales bacterium]